MFPLSSSLPPLARCSTASAGQLGIGQTLPGDLRKDFIEPLRVGDVYTIVEPKHLLVKVAIQVERLDTDVSTCEVPLGE